MPTKTSQGYYRTIKGKTLPSRETNPLATPSKQPNRNQETTTKKACQENSHKRQTPTLKNFSPRVQIKNGSHQPNQYESENQITLNHEDVNYNVYIGSQQN